MPTLLSDDANLYYDVLGSGPPVVLLHPFPLHHGFWSGFAPQLSSRYRLLIPDLRAHGDSELGSGPASMAKLADDLMRMCRAEGIGKASFVGVSIGGYLLFEFWRRYRGQVGALVLANTRAGAETPEGKANRAQIIAKIEREGTGGFIEEMLPKQLSPATVANRPDIVDAARRMMQKMSAADIIGVQQGIAGRPDSIATLAAIQAPTLVIAAEARRHPAVGDATDSRPRAGSAHGGSVARGALCGDGAARRIWSRPAQVSRSGAVVTSAELVTRVTGRAVLPSLKLRHHD